jgi:AcrR family transcriptional regulator
MSPRPDVSEERKNQILDAASAVFARLGFHEARMDDIVEEARLSKGALYWYFKSKDAIIAGLLERIFDHELAGIHALETAQGTVSERLVIYTRQMADMFERMKMMSAVAFQFYAVAARHKTVREFLKEYFATYRAVLARIVRQGVEQGEFRAVDPEATAVTIIGLFEGLALLGLLDSENMQWEAQALTGMRLILDGLRRDANEQ